MAPRYICDVQWTVRAISIVVTPYLRTRFCGRDNGAATKVLGRTYHESLRSAVSCRDRRPRTEVRRRHGNRSRDAPDGGIDRRGHDRPLDQEGRGQRRSRRAAVRDLHGQGGRRDSIAGRRRAHRDQGQGRRDRSGQRRRRHDWRGRRGASGRIAAGDGGAMALLRLRLPAGRRLRHPHSRRAMALRLPPPRPKHRRRRRPKSARSRTGRARLQPHGKDHLRRQRSSPLVRRIAREHNVDITTLSGSGIGGRVTKSDILGFLDRKPEPPAGGQAGGACRARRQERRACRDSAALRDAQEDRGAHDPEPADVGARAFRLPRELLDHREDPAAEEGGVRRARRAGSPTWRSSRRRSSTRSAATRHQRLARRRQRRLQEGREPGHRRRARRRADRARHQECRRAEHARPQPCHRRRGGARP